MPRRHSWLRDMHYELDHGPERRVPEQQVQTGSNPNAPVNITINVNLGDIVDKVIKGMQPKEALEEAVERYAEARRLTEREGDE